MYSVSNFGRVRNDKTGKILSTYRPDGVGKIYTRIKKKLARIQDLMYKAFIGSIPEKMIVICKDKDRRNLTLDNLVLKEASHKEKYKKQKQRPKQPPRADIMKGMQKEQRISLEDLTGEAREAQIQKLNGLAKYYYTDTVQNGVYYLKLKNS